MCRLFSEEVAKGLFTEDDEQIIGEISLNSVDGSAFCGALQKKKVFSTRENDAASVASPTH